MMGLRSKLLWGVLTVLMGLALWMSRLGQVYLYAVPDSVLESLASGKGYVSSELPWTLATFLRRPGCAFLDAIRDYCDGQKTGRIAHKLVFPEYQSFSTDKFGSESQFLCGTCCCTWYLKIMSPCKQ
jgi:hypothetical protein